MRPFTVLRAHNFYRESGGEDRVFEAEDNLLRTNGHTVVRYEDHNRRIGNSLAAGLNSIWNHSSYRTFETLSRTRHPDIAHFHNIFPLISPAAYYAANKHGIPVVQTLHNYRLICPGATLYRDGHVCEECVEKRSLRPALQHGCYRNSRAASGAVAASLLTHRSLGTWQNAVRIYIALSEFARTKYIEGGLPPDRIIVKPNYVETDPGVGDGRGGYALFVGRLAENKGLKVLAHAWSSIKNIPLRVVGDGPLRSLDWPSNVTVLSSQSRDRVMKLMKRAAILIFPSKSFECAPLTILEAFACGLPVIASRLGVMEEMVTDGRTGLLFRSGDAGDLSRCVRWAFDSRSALAAMRAAARKEYEDKYTATRNHELLMKIYKQCMLSPAT